MNIYLQQINAHTRDSHITFDEGPHIYTIDGSSDYISVTTWVHSFFRTFDADKVIDKMMNSKNWTNNKYYGKTKDEIKQEWEVNRDDAAKKGTQLHFEIETFYNKLEEHDIVPEIDISGCEVTYFKNFYNDLELKKISEISKKVLNKARTGSWEHIRIYRDYPNFFNKLNLFDVDYPLHSFLDKETYNEFQKLNYKNYILNFLEWKNFYTPLIRLHTNSSFYNYQGEWHRDDPNFPSENSVQVIIYLLDEKGYRIIPKH